MLLLRPRAIASLVLAGWLLSPFPLCAQDPPSPSPGDRLRVHRIGAPVTTAVLLRITPDSLTYTVDPDDGVGQTVSFHEVTRLQVSRGPVPAGHAFLRGAGIGVLSGGAVGAVAGAVAYEPCEPPDVPWGGLACIGDLGEGAAMLAGAMVGGLLGFLVGGVFAVSMPLERWEQVGPPARVTLSPGGAGTLSLRVAIRR